MNRIYEDLRYLKCCFEFSIKGKICKKRSLIEFKNIHKGKRCFVVCTGPSLRIEDVEVLKGEETFAVNSCFKIFDKTDWRPSYYVATDPIFIKDMGNELQRYQDEMRVVFTSNVANWNNPDANIVNVFPKYQNLPERGLIRYIEDRRKENFMSKDITQGVISGHTVVFSVLQIAEYMGFKEIYLLGTDCNYKGKLQYSELTPHMHINNPNAADLMIVDYLYAKRHFDKSETKVYNATRGGMLEVFERVNFDKVIAERKE